MLICIFCNIELAVVDGSKFDFGSGCLLKHSAHKLRPIVATQHFRFTLSNKLQEFKLLTGVG